MEKCKASTFYGVFHSTAFSILVFNSKQRVTPCILIYIRKGMGYGAKMG